MSRNTVSPELHRNEALTCVVRTGFCKSYTEEIWPRMHRSGARGSPHVDAVESHQLYLPGVPPGPLRCAAARPYECGTNGRLANPAKRTESIHLNILLLDVLCNDFLLADSH